MFVRLLHTLSILIFESHRHDDEFYLIHGDNVLRL